VVVEDLLASSGPLRWASAPTFPCGPRGDKETFDEHRPLGSGESAIRQPEDQSAEPACAAAPARHPHLTVTVSVGTGLGGGDGEQAVAVTGLEAGCAQANGELESCASKSRRFELAVRGVALLGFTLLWLA